MMLRLYTLLCIVGFIEMILTDTELRQKGLALLTHELGEVYAERFISSRRVYKRSVIHLF
jgi:hypothetical protein